MIILSSSGLAAVMAAPATVVSDRTREDEVCERQCGCRPTPRPSALFNLRAGTVRRRPFNLGLAAVERQGAAAVSASSCCEDHGKG
ncbi:hypothetical protein ACWGH2_14660 [Streptomyces sp. NPDC054871]